MSSTVPHRNGASRDTRSPLVEGFRLQVSTDPAGRPHVEAVVARARKKPITVSDGSAVVRIYKTQWRDKQRNRIYRSHTIVWRDVHGRHREKRNTLEAAEGRAQTIATSIINGDAALLEFSHADKASLKRCLELLQKARIDKPIELVIAEYTQCVQILDGRAPVDACRSHAAQYPVGVITRNAPDLVEEFFAKRKMSTKWARVLRKMLERYAAHFTGPLTSLQARELGDWLDGLKDKRKKPVGLQTRRNYFEAVGTLANFAKDRGYLAKDWNVLNSVDDPEPAPVEVNLYTPDELVKLLNVAEKTKAGRKLVPLIAITAFAGVRHGEMNEEKARLLDWGDIDFEGKSIYVGKGPAKTGRDRAVDMPPNLIAWLEPYARPRGRICQLKNTSNALCRLRRKASIEGPKKNALRKSFISYSNALNRNIDALADQAGNSASVIRKNYKRVGTRLKAEAERWFSIMPTQADLLPLFAWSKRT